jgi:hypothetical protein
VSSSLSLSLQEEATGQTLDIEGFGRYSIDVELS